MKEPADITERASEFVDFERKKVKAIILDGEKGKISLIDLPFHGDTTIEMVQGKTKRVRFGNEYLL